jgi:hypothetical protein
VNTTFELVATAIVFGGIGAISASRAALSMLMLTSATRPWARAIAYVAGSTLVFAAALLVGVLGVEATGRVRQDRVDAVLGVAMIGVAVILLVLERRRRGLPRPPSGHPVLSAFGIGLAVALQSIGRLFILVAGGYRLGALTNDLLVVAGYGTLLLVIWQASVWVPMAIFVFWRERFDALERRLRPAIDRIEEGPAGAIAVGIVGVLLLIRSFVG